jgi:hypothetical protein
MEQTRQHIGLWARPTAPRPPQDESYARRLADVFGSIWSDPAPNGLVGMVKAPVEAVPVARDIISGAYTVTPETPGQWSEIDEFRAQHARQRMREHASALGGAIMTGGMPFAPRGALGMAGGPATASTLAVPSADG